MIAIVHSIYSQSVHAPALNAGLMDNHAERYCTSTKATTTLLEEDFAHFGYPHTIVSDNATTISSAEFQEWCHYRGIKHLTGAPYHPATNGAAERLVQSFKQSLKKSKLPPRPALQEFLMQYRRTPLNTGFSPSQLLNGRQICTKIDSASITGTHRPGTSSYRCHKEPAERTIYSSACSYQIQRWNTMLRSVLWPKTYQLAKMSTSNCHQSAWYQVFQSESPP